MVLYQSEYLKIEQQQHLIIQSWTTKELHAEEYKTELYNFLQLFNKVKPKQLIWDNTNCNLLITAELSLWMGEAIITPLYKKGIKSLAFTIPENIPVYLSIINSLEPVKSLIQTVYFSDRKEAETKILSKGLSEISTLDLKSCIQQNNGTRFELNINISNNDLPYLLSYFQELNVDKEFETKNRKNIESLTH